MMTGNHRTELRKMYRHMRGVTLLELMIVTVIIGIMASIAYPNYRQFVARAKRNEAKAALLQIAQNQERFYLQNNTYTTDLTQLGFPVACPLYLTDTESYSICVTIADANDFTAVATYQRADAEAGKCMTFSIDGRGGKTSLPDTNCWTRTR
jgi:type IV pilus assembly protein PilE